MKTYIFNYERILVLDPSLGKNSPDPTTMKRKILVWIQAVAFSKSILIHVLKSLGYINIPIMLNHYNIIRV